MSRFVFRAEGSRISDPKPDAGIHLHILPFALKNLPYISRDGSPSLYILAGQFGFHSTAYVVHHLVIYSFLKQIFL